MAKKSEEKKAPAKKSGGEPLPKKSPDHAKELQKKLAEKYTPEQLKPVERSC